jgi:hypothetical protein
VWLLTLLPATVQNVRWDRRPIKRTSKGEENRTSASSPFGFERVPVGLQSGRLPSRGTDRDPGVTQGWADGPSIRFVMVPYPLYRSFPLFSTGLDEER